MNTYIKNFDVPKIPTQIIDDLSNAKLIKLSTCFSLIHNNIRSIAKNIDEFKIFLHKIEHSYDVIILTETWSIYGVSIYELEGYKTFYNNGHINQNDGILIYVKNTISVTSKIINISEINNNFLQLKMSLGKETILLTALYRSPSTCPTVFNKQLHKYFKSHKSETSDYLCFVGDININLKSVNVDFVDEYLNIMSEHGFISCINNDTRVVGQEGTCIDHIFLKFKQQALENLYPVIFKYQVTDHYPVALHLHLKQQYNNSNNLPYKKTFVNYPKLIRDLKYETWDEIYENTNIDIITESLIKKLTFLIKQNTAEVKFKKSQIKREPWMTNGLLRSICTKNKLHKNSKNNPTNEILDKKYKDYRN